MLELYYLHYYVYYQLHHNTINVKTKVIIENGKTVITLSPENEFEETVIENLDRVNSKQKIETEISGEMVFGLFTNSKIILKIE